MLKRQGDILFIRTDVVPEEAEEVKRVDGRVIVAEGEATGHHHAIRTPGVQMLEKEELRWLVADVPFEVEHEEHDTITFDPGVWVIRYQREYTPEAVRRVLD